jgi:Zn-dependent peptidase ImmA (M78 family)
MSPGRRIPTRVHFPFGYVVRVKQVGRAEMDRSGGEGCDGLWLVDDRLVLIHKGLSARRRRTVLAHELGHAWLDWQSHVEDEVA